MGVLILFIHFCFTQVKVLKLMLKIILNAGSSKTSSSRNDQLGVAGQHGHVQAFRARLPDFADPLSPRTQCGRSWVVGGHRHDPALPPGGQSPRPVRSDPEDVFLLPTSPG